MEEGGIMNKFESLKRCYHCGSVIQSEDQAKEGYIDKENLIGLSDKDVILCDSCYKKQRYNRQPAMMHPSDDFITMIKDAKASDSLIVNIIDLTSFECSLDATTFDLAKKLNYIIIGNKRDLLPSKYSDDGLKEYIKDIYSEYGINIQTDNIFLTSLLSSSFDISEISKEIEKRRNGHDVYIIGDISSGKSIFLNAFLRNYKNESNHSVGVSRYFGTNLNVLKIPLDSSSFIYDTPGSVLSNSFAKFKDDLAIEKCINTQDEYIGKKIPISEDGSLFISTLARIDYLKGKKKIIFNLHFPKKIQAKGITPKKNMDALFMKYLEKKALKPSLSFVSSISDYDIFDITINPDDSYQEIIISGLGWVSFLAKESIKLRIYVPKGIGIYAGRAKGHKK